MRSPRTPALQYINLNDILLRRRWVSDHELNKRLVHSLGIKIGFFDLWMQGKATFLGRRISVMRQLQISFCIQVLLSGIFCFGFIKAFPNLLNYPWVGPLYVIAVCFILGISSTPRICAFPFESMSRLSPATSSMLAKILLKSEVTYLFYRNPVIFLPIGYAFLIRGLSLNNHRQYVFIWMILLPFISFAAIRFGGVIGTLILKFRVLKKTGFKRFVTAFLISIAASIVGFFISNTVIFNFLISARSNVSTVDQVLEDSAWNSAMHDFSNNVKADIYEISKFYYHFNYVESISIYPIVFFLTIFILFSYFYRSSILTKRDRENTEELKDAVYFYLLGVCKFVKPFGYINVALARNMLKNRWVVSKYFWFLILPNPESSFILSFALGIINFSSNEWLILLTISIVSVMVINIQMSEIIYELMPTVGVASIQKRLRWLLLTPELEGIKSEVCARKTVTGVFLFPSSSIFILITSVFLVYKNFSIALLAIYLLVVIIAFFLAVETQWYMAPLLMVQTRSERDYEQGLGSASETLRSKLQGIPRLWYIVIPSYFVLGLNILGSLIPEIVTVVCTFIYIILLFFCFFILKYIGNKIILKIGSKGLDVSYANS